MTLYERFTAAVAQADQNAMIIMGFTLLALAAWQAIRWMPATWQPPMRLIAWIWVIVFLAGTVIYSL